eukprot:m.79825 g.79825  ORF g.79825 m.79825 type:complete len:199 (-) comp14640_c0_seq3:95-691(-)
MATGHAGAIAKAIVFGNTATQLAKASDESHTHSWTVYLRSPCGEDLSKFVSKVVFRLHESFSHPARAVQAPPYEVTESGWGEFEITITLHFVDPDEPPVTVFHLLKLYANEDTIDLNKKTIVCEHYDEIVFASPSPAMSHALLATSPTGPRQTARNYEVEEQQQYEQLQAIKGKVDNVLQDLKTRYAALDDRVRALKG